MASQTSSTPILTAMASSTLMSSGHVLATASSATTTTTRSVTAISAARASLRPSRQVALAISPARPTSPLALESLRAPTKASPTFSMAPMPLTSLRRNHQATTYKFHSRQAPTCSSTPSITDSSPAAPAIRDLGWATSRWPQPLQATPPSLMKRSCNKTFRCLL